MNKHEELPEELKRIAEDLHYVLSAWARIVHNMDSDHKDVQKKLDEAFGDIPVDDEWPIKVAERASLQMSIRVQPKE